MNRQKSNTRKGFSLLEMMMVVFILTMLVGAMFRQIDRAQVRYSVETRKLDLTQQDRDFIDQFTRDLHQAGYPSPVTYGNRLDLSSNRTAAGIWSISQTDLRMEADVDGDGFVEEIAYHYDNTVGGANNCPCLMRAPFARLTTPCHGRSRTRFTTRRCRTLLPFGAAAFSGVHRQRRGD